MSLLTLMMLSKTMLVVWLNCFIVMKVIFYLWIMIIEKYFITIKEKSLISIYKIEMTVIS